MAAYATPDDLAARFDRRSLEDLASDAGVPVVDLSTDPQILAALEDAAGLIEAACLVAGLYTADDLAGLAANARALLKRLNCELAMVLLLARRPEKYGGDYYRAMREATEEYLDRLRKGERLFGLAPQIDAGMPAVDGPSAVDLQNLNLITARVRNYFPHYAKRLPLGRQ